MFTKLSLALYTRLPVKSIMLAHDLQNRTKKDDPSDLYARKLTEKGGLARVLLAHLPYNLLDFDLAVRQRLYVSKTLTKTAGNPCDCFRSRLCPRAP